MPQHEAWQLQGDAAALYERHLVPAITAVWAADLVERAAPAAGEGVLDLACGTGIVARLAAARMGSGEVIGLDINAPMLAVARSLPAPPGVRVAWQEGSAVAIPLPEARVDLCLCQLGLQFFPDRAAALHEIARVLRHGGRLALSVYDAIETTPLAHALAEALDRRIGPGASATKRAEHELSDPAVLRGLAMAAGFHDISVRRVTQTIRFPSAALYARIQLTATPLAALAAGLGETARERLADAIAGDIAAALGSVDGEVVSPAGGLVLQARR
ncbi:class I SAM-dependent methyltransferase [Falsiroseomonas sp. HW251]|uniref:class I SAM-dependent methyltransferase n=1 Tax=Falsiroseomonas sp. HW251 TaxID=3390998 RepID=UPI003D31CF6D